MKTVKYTTIGCQLFLVLIFSAFNNLSYAADNKIVSIGPTATSIINALGLQNQLVGTDSQSKNIVSNKKVADIGYQRTLSLEGIVGLKPTLCIAGPDAAPKSVLHKLSSFKIAPLVLEQTTSPQSVYNNITAIGNITGKSKEALLVHDMIQAQVKQAMANIPHNKIVNVLFLLQLGPHQVYLLGKNTHANFWLEFLKAKNTISFSGMRPASAEGILTLAPDVIVIAKSSPLHNTPYEAQINMLVNKYHSRVINIDAQILDGFGADFGENTQFLVKKLYYAAS
jgi:iron complex transport system substrate-binding protein